MHRTLHKMLFVPILSGFVVLGLVAPASAERVDPTRDAPARDVALVDVRPDIRPDVRPPKVEVLSLGCEGRREGENLGAMCRWSTAEGVRAYQLWRVVDRGHRELVGTFDNETTIARDDVPDDARVVRYAVLGLDGDREIVARSRVVRIRFRHTDRPVDRPVVDRPVVDGPIDPIVDRSTAHPVEIAQEQEAAARNARRPLHLLPI